MIIWSGFGFLALLIPFVTCLLVIGPVSALAQAGYTSSHSWPLALGLLLGAAVTWIAGMRLNGTQRVLVDPQTGQPVTLRRRHSLFFIPLQYWGYILGAGALLVLLSDSGTTTH